MCNFFVDSILDLIQKEEGEWVRTVSDPRKGFLTSPEEVYYWDSEGSLQKEFRLWFKWRTDTFKYIMRTIVKMSKTSLVIIELL